MGIQAPENVVEFLIARPKPKLPLPDIEAVAGAVHAAWMKSKRDKGIASRQSETGEELMVPYESLSEGAKDLDRSSVKAVYEAIEACTT